MVSGTQYLSCFALEGCGDVKEQRYSSTPGVPLNTHKPVIAIVGKFNGKLLLVVGQHVHAEMLAYCDVGQYPRSVIDAYEHQRRREGNTGKGAYSDSIGQAILAHHGSYGYASWKTRARALEVILAAGGMHNFCFLPLRPTSLSGVQYAGRDQIFLSRRFLTRRFRLYRCIRTDP